MRIPVEPSPALIAYEWLLIGVYSEMWFNMGLLSEPQTTDRAGKGLLSSVGIDMGFEITVMGESLITVRTLKHLGDIWPVSILSLGAVCVGDVCC